MSKQIEDIRIEIDPDTLAYKIDFGFAYIGDLYIVVRDIKRRMESGKLAEEMELADEHGNRFTIEDLRRHIADIGASISDSECSTDTTCFPSNGFKD